MLPTLTAVALAATPPPAAPTRPTPTRTATPRAASPAPSRPVPTSAPAGGPGRLDGIAAVVDNDPVLESDVEEQLVNFLSQTRARPDSALVDTLRHQILEQLIDDRLVVAEAKRQGVSVTDAEIKKQLDQAIAAKKDELGGEEAFQEQLRKENLTEAKVREKYRTEL